MEQCYAPVRRYGLAGLMAALLLAQATRSGASNTADECTDFCPGTGACTVGALWEIDAESVLDCSGRDITIGPGGELSITSATMTLRARDISISTGGWLTATDGSVNVVARNLTIDGNAAAAGGIRALEGDDESVGEVSIRLSDPADSTPPTAQGNMVLKGAIRANGQRGAGNVSVVASGNISIQNYGTDGIEAGGTGADASGGEIYLEAGGTVTVYDPIHAEGASSGDSGGGTIEIVAGGDLITDQDGHINAPGRSLGGGSVSLTSQGGDVIVREHVEADGIGEVGDAGSITIHAGDRVEILEQMYARGGFLAGGGAATGGTIDIEGGCGGVLVSASLFTYGGALGSIYDGGGITIDSNGDTTVGANVVLDTRAQASGGKGGTVSVSARNVVSIAGTAKLDARGSTAASGRGGNIRASGCRVDVAPGAILDSTGNFGGLVDLGATKTPLVGQVQPLVVGAGSQLKVAGTVAANAGRIRTTPLHLKGGTCSNPGRPPCFLSTDCANGCETGSCVGANPDTAGVNSQFDVVPVRADNRSLPTCQSACPQ